MVSKSFQRLPTTPLSFPPSLLSFPLSPLYLSLSASVQKTESRTRLLLETLWVSLCNKRKAELGYYWRRCGYHCAVNEQESQVTT